jgi:hypothetical protein
MLRALPSKPWFPLACKLLSLGVALLLIFTLSMPIYVDGVVFLVLIITARRSSWQNFALITVSLALVSILLAVIAVFSPWQPARYYREHEKYARTDSTYTSNIKDDIEVPYGDLLAIDPMAPPALREPRKVHFETDSLGYRNSKEYQSSQWILVGDSFILGTSTDQTQTLPEVLGREYGQPSYQIAYPGDPLDYERRAAWFISLKSPGAGSGEPRILLFIYEGNDFRHASRVPVFKSQRPVIPGWWAGKLNRYDIIRAKLLDRLAPRLEYPKVLFAMSRRVERLVFLREATRISAVPIGGKLVGFTEGQSLAAVEPHLEVELDWNPEVLKRTRCVFFIPTKLRTYAEWLPEDIRSRIVEPAPAFLELSKEFRRFGIPVVDLTAALREEARKALKTGEYVWWRDDTHWNGRGIRAVAPLVKDCAMKSRPHNLPVMPEGWDYSLAGDVLRSAKQRIAVGDFGKGIVDGGRRAHGTVILKGTATGPEGQSALRALGFLDGKLVSSAPVRNRFLYRPSRSDGFEVSIPMNLAGPTGAGIRIFAVTDAEHAMELKLPEGLVERLQKN